jgi:hypothetical protein
MFLHAADPPRAPQCREYTGALRAKQSDPNPPNSAFTLANQTLSESSGIPRCSITTLSTRLLALRAVVLRHPVRGAQGLRQCAWRALMGDLPIFIAHHSADCWARPTCTRWTTTASPRWWPACRPTTWARPASAGATRCTAGTAWPSDGYAWWTAARARMLHQADVFRIDHFRGFAGYWEIPASSPTANRPLGAGPGRPLFDAIGRRAGCRCPSSPRTWADHPDVHASPARAAAASRA